MTTKCKHFSGITQGDFISTVEFTDETVHEETYPVTISITTQSDAVKCPFCSEMNFGVAPLGN